MLSVKCQKFVLVARRRRRRWDKVSALPTLKKECFFLARSDDGSDGVRPMKLLRSHDDVDDDVDDDDGSDSGLTAAAVASSSFSSVGLFGRQVKFPEEASRLMALRGRCEEESPFDVGISLSSFPFAFAS